jgi:hypothetical protein
MLHEQCGKSCFHSSYIAPPHCLLHHLHPSAPARAHSFLGGHKIPVAAVGIGPIHKKDVMKAGVMLERAPEYASILAFDVRITQDTRDLAETMGVKIFTAEIIYHLFDQVPRTLIFACHVCAVAHLFPFSHKYSSFRIDSRTRCH